VRDNFHETLHPPHDPLQHEPSRAISIAGYRDELVQAYKWRLRFCEMQLGQKIALEFHALSHMGNFDEKPMTYLPLSESPYWGHQQFTLGVCTFADDSNRPAPIVIERGRLQAPGSNPVQVPYKGKNYAVYHYRNDTGKMNEFIFKEYLQKELVPNLRGRDFGQFPEETVAKLVQSKTVGALFIDRYKSHWTAEVLKLAAGEGIELIVVPNTKLGQPNDFGTNHFLGQEIMRDLSDWCKERRTAVASKKSVPQLTKVLIMEKLLVQSLTLYMDPWE